MTLRTVAAAGVEIGRGSRVVLRPRAGGDIFGAAMAGMVATVEAIHEDLDGKVHLAVTLEDDPGQALGEDRRPGHREPDVDRLRDRHERAVSDAGETGL